MGVAIGKSRSSETLFRARVINEGAKPTMAAHMGAPPANLVPGFQRCNAPGQSVFYSSSRRMTALLECRVRPGDTVYLSQWMSRQPYPINLHFDAADHLASTRSAQAEALFSHFETLFSRRIAASFSDDYKFTAAIAELLTRGLPSASRLDIREDRSVALRYPSVVKYDDSINTSMSASMANDRLELVHVMELRIKDVFADAVKIDVLDNGFGRKNGLIEWTGVAANVPTLRDPGGVLFIHQGSGEWNIRVHHDPYAPAYLDELLME